MDNNFTKQITYTGIMTALVFLATYLIKIPLPYTGGYIHLGDSMVFIAGILLGRKRGAFAAGVGSALADIFAGYVVWALPTLIIKAFMAYIIGYVYHNRNSFKSITILTSVYVVMWSGFNIILRNILNSTLDHDKIINLLDNPDIKSSEDLIQTISKLETNILIALVSLPLIAIALLFILKKVTSISMTTSSLIGFIIAGSFMIVMYYLTELYLYGSHIIPIFTIPMNIIQFLSGLFIALMLLPFLKHISIKTSSL